MEYCWKHSNIGNHKKSLIHSVSLIALSLSNFVDPFITSAFSTGYYIDDTRYMLQNRIKPLFFVHHIFSIVESYIALYEPYSSLNMYYNILPIIEGSVPFLNIYYITRNYYSLIFYLFTHVYFRNYRLTLYYLYLDDVLVLSQTQHFIILLFIGVNYWWTYEILSKINNC